MEDLFGKVTGVYCFQDDILITAKDERGHDNKVKEVMEILKKAGLTIQAEKCKYKMREVTYLGHTISKTGISPKVKLVDAIVKSEAPKDKVELRSFLGLAEYYSKFMSNFAVVTAPLRDLLREKVEFVWSKECQAAFDGIKHSICSAPALAPFDNKATSYLHVDASMQGLGAAFIQRQKGDDRVVAYASRCLKEHEKNYSTIEREAMACWWAVKYFGHYLWGAPFTIKTDHKPLLYIFTTKGTECVSKRVVRWVCELMEYNFTVEFLPGKKNVVADYLSRKPVRDGGQEDMSIRCIEVDSFEKADWASAISEEEWKLAVDGDLVYREVMDQISSGSRKFSQQAAQYNLVSDELSVSKWGLKRGDRWIPPNGMRRKITCLGHEGHLGRTKTKCRVRMWYWWPGMDGELDECVRACQMCACSDKVLKVHKEPLQPVQYELLPWSKLALDIIGPIEKLPTRCKFGVVLVDYYTKWFEVKFVASVTSKVIIEFLESIFEREGVPSTLVTDNGVQLVSREMQEFLERCEIKHTTTSLYNPKANGLVERVNRVIKESLQLSMMNGMDWERNLRKMLWAYRTTMNAVTKESPFKLMRGRNACTKLRPAWQKREEKSIGAAEKEDMGVRIQRHQDLYKGYYDKRNVAKKMQINVGDWVKIFLPMHNGKTKYMGPYKVIFVGVKHVKLENGKLWSMDRVVKVERKDE